MKEKGGGLNLKFCPDLGDLEYGLSPPNSPPCPHGGRWGKTLIGA